MKRAALYSQKIAAPAEQPSPAADKAANEDKTTDAPDRP